MMETTAIIKICKFTVFSSGSFCQIYRVIDEALITEALEWPSLLSYEYFICLKNLNFLLLLSIMFYLF